MLLYSIQDQGDCGSCWAFSATQHIESAFAMAGNPLSVLSHEQILECDEHDGACYGGWPSCAIQYTIEAGGLSKLEDYRNGTYLADGHVICLANQSVNDSCDDPPCTNYCEITCDAKQVKPFAKIHSYVTLGNDEKQMQAYLAKYGPMSVALNAGGLSFQFYKGGVIDTKWYDSCNPSRLDHAVFLVGYGTDAGKDYWLVKNRYVIFSHDNCFYIQTY
jgi:hypothetical protein